MQPNYRRKDPEVFARLAERDMTVLHHVKGAQHAKKDDYLVGTEKGKLEVFKPAAFHALYEPIPATVDVFAGIEVNENGSDNHRK